MSQFIRDRFPEVLYNYHEAMHYRKRKTCTQHRNRKNPLTNVLMKDKYRGHWTCCGNGRRISRHVLKFHTYGSAIRELLAIFSNTLCICLIMLESTTVQSHICTHLPDSGQCSESFDSDLQIQVCSLTKAMDYLSLPRSTPRKKRENLTYSLILEKCSK